MDKFWDTLADNFKSAFEDAEKNFKTDMFKLSSVPELMSFMKEMGPEDLMMLLQQARRIKKRKNPKRPPINGGRLQELSATRSLN
nr:hypothetical protein [Serratia marcescens]